jgi:hypothetical protein
MQGVVKEGGRKKCGSSHGNFRDFASSVIIITFLRRLLATQFV